MCFHFPVTYAVLFPPEPPFHLSGPSACILDISASLAQCTSLGFPSSFGLWYRGESEAPEAEISNPAPSSLQEGEETPQQPHLQPVNSLPAPNS